MIHTAYSAGVNVKSVYLDAFIIGTRGNEISQWTPCRAVNTSFVMFVFLAQNLAWMGHMVWPETLI